MEGKYLQRFGQGRLLGPKGVAVDAEGRLVIVDNKASAIYVYQVHDQHYTSGALNNRFLLLPKANGKLLRKFGARGNRPSQFAGPHYVAINVQNNWLYITDFHNHCVKV